jgi:hypothetical protein
MAAAAGRHGGRQVTAPARLCRSLGENRPCGAPLGPADDGAMALVAEIHSRVLVLLKHYGTIPLHHVLAKVVKVPPVKALAVAEGLPGSAGVRRAGVHHGRPGLLYANANNLEVFQTFTPLSLNSW